MDGKKVNQSIWQLAKIDRNSQHQAKFLKFCPLCLEEDRNKYGEAYWHRHHQIPGILVCLKHEIALLDSQVLIGADSIHYHGASLDNCLTNSPIKYSSNTLEKLISLAQDIECLSNAKLNFKGMFWLRSRYQDYLVKRKFITIYTKTKFKLDEQKIAEAFWDFYGQDFLEVIQPNIIHETGKHLANYLLACDLNPVIARITHILIIKFLAGSLTSFFSNSNSSSLRKKISQKM